MLVQRVDVIRRTNLFNEWFHMFRKTPSTSESIDSPKEQCRHVHPEEIDTEEDFCLIEHSDVNVVFTLHSSHTRDDLLCRWISLREMSKKVSSLRLVHIFENCGMNDFGICSTRCDVVYSMNYQWVNVGTSWSAQTKEESIEGLIILEDRLSLSSLVLQFDARSSSHSNRSEQSTKSVKETNFGRISKRIQLKDSDRTFVGSTLPFIEILRQRSVLHSRLIDRTNGMERRRINRRTKSVDEFHWIWTKESFIRSIHRKKNTELNSRKDLQCSTEKISTTIQQFLEWHIFSSISIRSVWSLSTGFVSVEKEKVNEFQVFTRESIPSSREKINSSSAKHRVMSEESSSMRKQMIFKNLLKDWRSNELGLNWEAILTRQPCFIPDQLDFFFFPKQLTWNNEWPRFGVGFSISHRFLRPLRVSSNSVETLFCWSD